MLMHGQLLEPINELISDTLVNGILLLHAAHFVSGKINIKKREFKWIMALILPFSHMYFEKN